MRTTTSTPSRVRARTPAAWLARTAVRRARAQWRPLVVVLAVATVVTTLLSTLTLLVTASEDAAVRRGLAALPDDAVAVSVRVDVPAVDVTELADRTHQGLAGALGVPVAAGPVDARSSRYEIPRPGLRNAITWVSVLAEVRDRTELVEGEWPTDPQPGEPLPVAMPRVAADALDLELGGTVELLSAASPEPITVRLVGIVQPVDLDDPWWSRDPLRGVGHNPTFPVPFSQGFAITDLVGPVLTTTGGLAAADVRVSEVTMQWAADVRGVGLDRLDALRAGLRDLSPLVADSLGDATESAVTLTDLGAHVGELAAALVVTRGGVVVVGLLLVVVAVATLTASARLLGEARKAEHELMRARGASRGQLVLASVVESVVLGAVAAVGGTLLAAVVHRLLVDRTSLAGTGGLDVGPLPVLVAVATVLLVAVVGATPLLGPADTFVESETANARPERRAALARAGVDVVLVVLAGLAYWQLRTYSSPLTAGGGALRVDPVLVAGPAVVLVAATLLSLRLLPAAARLTERVAGRGRGLVAPLAAWEVGRRSARAATAVLLLAVTVAVSTFTQAFLATWSSSQADQAAFRVGGPVVVAASGPAGVLPRTLEADGSAAGGRRATVPVHPVLRDRGAVTTWTGEEMTPTAGGRDVDVLALAPGARELLTHGRVAQEGGAAVAGLPTAPEAGHPGVPLPEDALGLSGTVSVTNRPDALPGTDAFVRLLVEDAGGLLTVLEIPVVNVGQPEPFRVLLDGVRPATVAESRAAGVPEADALRRAGALRTPLRLVGVQAQVVVRKPELLGDTGRRSFEVTVRLDDVGVVLPDGTPSADGTVAARSEAFDVTGLRLEPARVVSAARAARLVEDAPLGLVLDGTLEQLVLAPAVGAATAWPEQERLPVVVSSVLAERLDAEVGTALVGMVDGVPLTLSVAAVTPQVPTLGGGEHLVLDHTSLARVLALHGSARSTVDAWWVDVPAPRVDAYLAGLPDDVGGRSLAERATSVVGETRELRESPARVALPAALWLVTAGAALVAALGFGVHTTMTLRSRDLELAQLRAVGLQRGRLVGVVATETLLVSVLGVAVGIGVGSLLAWSVSPLVSIGPDGGPPVPAVVVQLPWLDVALVVAGLLVVVGLTVVSAALRQRTADPAAILRAAAGR